MAKFSEVLALIFSGNIQDSLGKCWPSTPPSVCLNKVWYVSHEKSVCDLLLLMGDSHNSIALCCQDDNIENQTVNERCVEKV
jgi:hypothetical protein